MNKVTDSTPWLGCIADDFTGATDLASFLVASGLRTIQVNGLPTPQQIANIKDVDAVVIAVKSRTIPVQDAVELSLACLEVLQSLGCAKYYFKYCSTFDSTPEGNIGPVIDALMSKLNAASTVVCPALPVNGRTVYQGHLFVFDQLLHESPMKDHPLTPMKDSSLVRMMEAQGTGKAVSIPSQVVEQGPGALTEALETQRVNHHYLVLDALSTDHLKCIGECLSSFTLITGGSGLAIGLGKEFEDCGGNLTEVTSSVQPIAAPTLVLSGSCSAMTQKQVAAYRTSHPVMELDPAKLVTGEQSVDSIITWLASAIDRAPLVTATAAPDIIAENHQNYGAEFIAGLIEQTFGALAIAASDQLGVRNFVVAGGETSGAVVNALGVDSFYIGKSIAPGVPMVQTPGEQPINLALKSGNFGQQDFFFQALETLSCC
ncbi:four-carbon acid sugar kinase family protein [Alteromonas aestuariivivens]|uniref:3-oxo-tetronate kinase n=1 Tax=Alteromonas aestuariivivens TaxID=1938339 RepID=A0A3D8ME48_9ALTE|nr:3-oxo-tetronate kinase [Alteromonas aestuariivivens]RDV29139.1 four-carbon acid sugar kinase family protein [Alteromonas aestuariivivens]